MFTFDDELGRGAAAMGKLGLRKQGRGEGYPFLLYPVDSLGIDPNKLTFFDVF
jgi:hypothetical protein